MVEEHVPCRSAIGRADTKPNRKNLRCVMRSSPVVIHLLQQIFDFLLDSRAPQFGRRLGGGCGVKKHGY